MTFVPREWTLGRSFFRLERPDLLSAKLQGGGTLEEVKLAVDLYRELAAAGPFFLLSDVSQAERIEERARRHISKYIQPEWILGFIYFNARLLHRSTATAILLTYEVLEQQPHPWRKRIHFVPTREAGLALYIRLRTPLMSSRTEAGRVASHAGRG